MPKLAFNNPQYKFKVKQAADLYEHIAVAAKEEKIVAIDREQTADEILQDFAKSFSVKQDETQVEELAKIN